MPTQTKKKTKKGSDWRKTLMERVRKLINQTDKRIVEAIKYRTPSNPKGAYVWYHEGMITTGETCKAHLRFAFAKGPMLKDPKGLINTYRAIVIKEGEKLNEKAFKELIKEAVALNSKPKKK